MRDMIKRRETNRRSQQAARNRIRAFVREQKTSRGCADCGIRHPAVLCFHHRDPADKAFSITLAVGQKVPFVKIVEEIEKCDVLCANCHAIRHWLERAD